ncbi:hypothetical protein, partial [Bradyrhizobium sp. CCBAU 11357]|uniref:hypothetical protein n=1 Tax=Bradyrhizobium sp. CCBAU 11357 TaxID=1630808 RepID=UPI0023020CE9
QSSFILEEAVNPESAKDSVRYLQGAESVLFEPQKRQGVKLALPPRGPSDHRSNVVFVMRYEQVRRLSGKDTLESTAAFSATSGNTTFVWCTLRQ